MATLKPLEELLKSDPIHKAFVLRNRETGEVRPLGLIDNYEIMKGLELSEKVSEDIQTAFVVVRTLWLYGWFCYPFYTLATFHAFLCLEMALRRKCQLEKYHEPDWPKDEDRSPGLARLIKAAIKNNWITDAGIRHAQAIRNSPPDELDLIEGYQQMAAGPEPWESDHQHYCKVLAETIPYLRNESAHPKMYFHGIPESIDIQNTHDIIEQLFNIQ
ncbi:MAG: hypothetical protein AB1439_07935 [candidate division FCPU426 bacterium]